MIGEREIWWHVGDVRSLFAHFFLLSAPSLFLISCASDQGGVLGKSEATFRADFSKGAIQVYQTGLSPEEDKRPLVLVHGSPGQAKDWSRYFDDSKLRQRFHLIAYDRPGYGESTSGFVDFEGQVEALAVLLSQQSRPVTLVGHSLGGAIVLAAAARFPDKVHEVVALAPAADYKPGFVFKMNRFLRCSGLGWLMIYPWRDSHLEILALYPALRNLQPELNGIKTPVTIVQGGRDKLVPATSIPYLKENLTAISPEIILLENEGHFIPWKRYGVVKRVLMGEANPSKGKLKVGK